ncbi:hypothetical protein [Weissella cibaria]|uniref:hypothetical protein n=1 Tax=Weissella cibaria TaxID=137591 RepID=UPI001C1FC2A2|nr:hypothetical protein [Weissella cibaria]MBU7544106.1 hypothetical protein [Weissella cibaria]MCV3317611.1 hypothetical protein [Weissella cibaria]
MSRKARLLLTILWVAGLLAGFSSGQLYRIAHPKQITDASQLVLTAGQADTTIKRTQKKSIGAPDTQQYIKKVYAHLHITDSVGMTAIASPSADGPYGAHSVILYNDANTTPARYYVYPDGDVRADV